MLRRWELSEKAPQRIRCPERCPVWTVGAKAPGIVRDNTSLIHSRGLLHLNKHKICTQALISIKREEFRRINQNLTWASRVQDLPQIPKCSKMIIN
jgi:hypothetical protein